MSLRRSIVLLTVFVTLSTRVKKFLLLFVLFFLLPNPSSQKSLLKPLFQSNLNGGNKIVAIEADFLIIEKKGSKRIKRPILCAPLLLRRKVLSQSFIFYLPPSLALPCSNTLAQQICQLWHWHFFPGSGSSVRPVLLLRTGTTL